MSSRSCRTAAAQAHSVVLCVCCDMSVVCVVLCVCCVLCVLCVLCACVLWLLACMCCAQRVFVACVCCVCAVVRVPVEEQQRAGLQPARDSRRRRRRRPERIRGREAGRPETTGWVSTLLLELLLNAVLPLDSRTL